MNRLTSERCSGIKTGYWSPAKKDELIQRLGKYEDTGLEPEEIRKATEEREKSQWISVKDRLPGEYKTVLLHTTESFFSETVVGYRARVVAGGCFWYACGRGNGVISDSTVTHWMPLPEPPEVKK